jgi:hypothetical protein
MPTASSSEKELAKLVADWPVSRLIERVELVHGRGVFRRSIKKFKEHGSRELLPSAILSVRSRKGHIIPSG